MLKRSILTTAATAAMFASATFAFAQKQNDSAGGSPGATGQGDQPSHSATEKAPGQAKDAGESARDKAPGQTKADGEPAKSKAPGQTKDDTAQRPGEQMKKGDKEHTGSTEADHTKDKASEKASDAGKAAGGLDAHTTDHAKADGNQATGKAAIANVAPETKTKVRTVFTQHRVEPARDIKISINVGVAVPRTIKLYSVPEEVVILVPAYRSYRYFLIDDRICIVDPETFEIVDVIIIT